MSRVPATAQSAASDQGLRDYFLRRLASLDRERSFHLATWRETAVQFAPLRGRFGESDRGPRKTSRIIDNTPLLAARTLASGMMAGISSPARPWFRLRLADDAANSQPGVRSWLDEVQKRLLHIFATSNLYNCLHTLYGELGAFGTAALWVDEDEEDVVRGYALTAGEYWLASSNRLAVDTIYRTMRWSVRQIVDTFGLDSVSPTIRSAWESSQLDGEHEIVQAIEPNPNFAVDAMGGAARGMRLDWAGDVAAHLPWRSAWFERSQQGDRPMLRIGGYQEFPCMAPRWEVAATDTWGSGPGLMALGDARQLQVQQTRKLEAIEKQVRPPMVGPPSLRNEPMTLLPGGVTYVMDMAGQTFKPAIDVRLDLRALTADIAEVQERIRRAFYADLFLMMVESRRQQVTAREIDERHEEKMLMLGPVLERLHDELLDPLVVRVFNIAARNGLIPPAPASLPLASLQIEFISLLASAQKAAATGAIERFWQFGAQIAALKPEAMDRLDADGTMEAYADMTGVPASIVVDRASAKAIRLTRLMSSGPRASGSLMSAPEARGPEEGGPNDL